jgi:HSP20 family protein
MSEQSEGIAVRRLPFANLEPPKPWDLIRGVALPSIDITKTESSYLVRAELPGIAKDGVTIELEQGVFSIRGETESRREENFERGRGFGGSYGSFSWSFTLPQDADEDQVSAEFRDGVLTVAVAKHPERKPAKVVFKS